MPEPDRLAFVPDSDRERRRTRRWIFAILLVALGLRVVGCFGKGLPYTYYKDEENNVQRALKFGAQNTLDPGWFHKPTLGYYIWFFEFGVYYLAGKATGSFSDPQDFAISYFNDPGNFYLIGRFNAALFGTLGVLLAYRLGKRIRGRSVGVLAAMLLAASFGQAASSEEVKKDIVSAFFTALGALVLLDVMEKGRFKDYLLAGLFAGLGTATKYYSIALVLPALYVHFFRTEGATRRSARVWLSSRALAGVLSFFGGFFIGAPYCFLSPRFWNETILPQFRFLWQRFFGGILGQSVDVPHRGFVQDGNSIWDSFDYIARTLRSREGLGLLVFCLVVLGLVVLGAKIVALRPPPSPRDDAKGATRRRDVFLLLTIVSCGGFVALMNRQFPEARHLNILYPFLAVAGAVGFLGAWQFMTRRVGRGDPAKARLAPFVLAVLLAIPAPGFPFRELVVQDLDNLEPDVRNVALAWIRENIPAGSTILNDKEWLPLQPTESRCQQVIRRLDRRRRSLVDQIEIHKSAPAGAAKDDGIAACRQKLNQTETYLNLWGVQRKAALRSKNPLFDVMPWNHDWYSYELNAREQESTWYNPTWEHSPWGRLFGEVFNDAAAAGLRLDPAEARRRFLARLRSEVASFARAELLREGVPADALESRLSAKITELSQAYRLTSEGVSLVELWRRRSPLSQEWLRSERHPGEAEKWTGFEWFTTVRITFDNYLQPHRIPVFPDWSDFYVELKSHFNCHEFGSAQADLHQTVRIYDLRTRVDTPVVTRMP